VGKKGCQQLVYFCPWIFSGLLILLIFCGQIICESFDPVFVSPVVAFPAMTGMGAERIPVLPAFAFFVLSRVRHREKMARFFRRNGDENTGSF